MAINLIDGTETFYVKTIPFNDDPKALIKQIPASDDMRKCNPILTVDQLPPYGGMPCKASF